MNDVCIKAEKQAFGIYMPIYPPSLVAAPLRVTRKLFWGGLN